MRQYGCAALIALLVLGTGGVGTAETVPYRQNMVVMDIVPDEGETFPDGTLQHFVIDMHRSDEPDVWWNVVTTDPDVPDTTPLKLPWDLERDGLHYEFRVVPYAHWPGGDVEELEPCLSGWVKARRAHSGGCQWENR